jgi:hypothetical protein
MLIHAGDINERLDGDARQKPVMLALFTLRHSDRAIETTLQKAHQCKRMIIVYGHFVNVGLYFLESGIGLFPDLKAQCERELLTELERQWYKKIAAIIHRAEADHVQVVAYIRAERFISLCLDVIEKEKPFLIVTTRPHGPAWLRRLGRYPGNHLAFYVACPVMEV